MHDFLYKLLILGILILLITLYLYIIVNNTDNFELQQQIIQDQPLSTLLKEQIALKLKISNRRLINIKYTGNLDDDINMNMDIDNTILLVSFTVLDPTLIEIKNGATNAQTVIDNANNLFNTNKFIIKINNNNILLNRINTQNTTKDIPYEDKNDGTYFNNTGLQDIETYTKNKYITVPNDILLTQFYELKYDNNFILNPILAGQTTQPPNTPVVPEFIKS